VLSACDKVGQQKLKIQALVSSMERRLLNIINVKDEE
jgi:hypothetical protein